MIQKILLYIIYTVVAFNHGILFASSFGPEDIKPESESIMPTDGGGGGTGLLDDLLKFLGDSIFGILGLVAIGMFIFIGGRLVVARGNPEEFKSAMMSFVYAVIGIFVVAASWALIELFAGINV